jgi:uncharacterized coiled-coil protein SlyX
VESSVSALDVNELRKREKALEEKLTDKDETISYLSKALWKADYATRNVQGDNDFSNLMQDPIRADEADANLTEAVIRACKAELRVDEIGALLAERDVRVHKAEMRLKGSESKLSEAAEKLEKKRGKAEGD